MTDGETDTDRANRPGASRHCLGTSSSRMRSRFAASARSARSSSMSSPSTSCPASSSRSRCTLNRFRFSSAAFAKEDRQAGAKQARAAVEKLAAKLAHRDQLPHEMQRDLKNLVAKYRQIIDIGLQVVGSGRLQNHETIGAHLTANAISRLVANELFRISATAFIGGGMGGIAPPSFPGAAPVSITNPDPGAIRPLSEVVREGSDYAASRLRAGLPEEEQAA